MMIIDHDLDPDLDPEVKFWPLSGPLYALCTFQMKIMIKIMI
jgi:hypothetical protein